VRSFPSVGGLLVVIDEFDLVRSMFGPDEADTELVDPTYVKNLSQTASTDSPTAPPHSPSESKLCGNYASGVYFPLAEILFAGPHDALVDDRFDYGEVRQIAFGLIADRLFVCVYVDRQAERRVISLRKANRREVKRYAETHQ
jgi:uncharacterized DUF497 family protein